MDDDRLTDIETKLAYQESTIRDLNDVVCEQQKEIERLNAGVEKLLKRYGELAGMIGGIDGAADQKPPHY